MNDNEPLADGSKRDPRTQELRAQPRPVACFRRSVHKERGSFGTYDSAIAFGRSRAQVVWERLILSNGASLQLESPPATDTARYAGLSDDVDFHTWSLLKGIALSTILNMARGAATRSWPVSSIIHSLRG